MIYNRHDWLYTALVSLFILVLAICSVTTGVTNWGDDFAAYINEGIAIADGRFDEQIALNYEQHPSALVKEAKDEKLVYVWGFPLFQAAVYKCFGFNRVDYSTVIWYKIPEVLSLSLAAGILYLLFRRRFKPIKAVFLALLFSVSGDLFEAINELYVDLPFLFISFLTLLIMECYADGEHSWKGGHKNSTSWLIGIGYGIVLWLTYETRLNGWTICVIAAVSHIMRLGKGGIEKKRIVYTLLPYVVLVALIFVSEHLWLAPATPNLSDVGSATKAEIGVNCKYYWDKVLRYLSDLPGMTIPVVGYVAAILCAVGIFTAGISGRNLHFTLLLIGTFAVLIMLPYTQGLRYLYSVLPILLMYMVYGAERIGKTVGKVLEGGSVGKTVKDGTVEKATDDITVETAGRDSARFKTFQTIASGIVLVVAAEMLFFPLAAQITRDYINLTHWGERDEYDAYNDDVIEMYRFIQENTTEEAVVAFAKPRALYLNTGRRSFRPGINGHEVMDADYFLFCKLKYGDFPDIDPKDIPAKVILDNDVFALYEIKRE